MVHARDRGRGARALAAACAVAVAACGLSIAGGTPSSSGPDDGGPPTVPTGAGDAGAAGPVDGATPCAPSPTDPRACGASCRDCGGGECKDGRCLPYPISDAIPAPWYVAVDSSQLYVTSHVYRDAGTGAVYALAKTGGAPVALTSTADSFDVLPGDANLIFSSLRDKTLWTVPRTGGALPRQVWDGDGETFDLARRDGITYFTSRGPLDHGVRALTPEGATSELVSLAMTREVEGIAVDETHVYWANRSGSIGRVRRDGSERSEDWHPAARVRRLTVDDDAIYWTSDTSAFRTPKDGSVDVALVADVGFGTIVIDGEHAYVTADKAGRVVRVNKRDGSDLVELATGLLRPMGLADDGASLYFTERDRGRVWRMTK